MTRDILLVAPFDGLDKCAQTLSEQLGRKIDIALNRRTGLEALRHGRWGAVIVDESLAEADPAWAEQMWREAGVAVTLEVKFSILGCARLGREIKAALERRSGEQTAMRRAVALELEHDLRSSLTGLLLQSELALQEPLIPPVLEQKLKHILELAGTIRERLRSEPA
jgi:signal transduction histidine kinase